MQTSLLLRNNYQNMPKNGGFSTIIAILITAFLTVLSAGILYLAVTESFITHSFSRDVSTYAGAEAWLEYALLKQKNHREGFYDTGMIGEYESRLLAKDPNNFTPSDESLEYTMQTFATAYSGSINPGDFDIVPLFYDEWQPIAPVTKNPNPNTSQINKTASFSVQILSGSLAWNILWNDINGTTFGLVGSTSEGFGNGSGSTQTFGIEKSLGNGGDPTKFTMANVLIGTFLNQMQNNYLILSNPTDSPVNYQITSSNGFSLPKTTIIASSQVANVRKNLQITQNRSSTMSILKYSLFNK